MLKQALSQNKKLLYNGRSSQKQILFLSLFSQLMDVISYFVTLFPICSSEGQLLTEHARVGHEPREKQQLARHVHTPMARPLLPACLPPPC